VTGATVLIASHTALISGAEAATLELLQERQDEFRYVWASPEGPLAEQVRRLGAHHVRVRGTAGSLRLQPLGTPKAIAELAALGVGLRRAAARHGADLIHAISMRAGIGAAISRRLGGPPFVVFQHDVAPEGPAGRPIRALVDPAAARLAGCSQHVVDTLRAAGFTTPADVITEPVDLAQFDPAKAAPDAARERLAPRDGPLLGLVGQITPWKGHDTAVRALARVRREHPRARLAIVGEVKFAARATRFDNHRFMADLQSLVAAEGLEEAVVFAGQRADVPDVVAALDALLVPSWDEPFGRVVIEAMAMGTPVVATSVGGPAETITHGRDGLLAPPRDDEAWARAIARLLGDPEAARRMAAAGRETARRHGTERFLAAVRATQRAALAAR
jgi:L-malate glycosyltransferase